LWITASALSGVWGDLGEGRRGDLGGSGANFKKGRSADSGALGEMASLACQIGPKMEAGVFQQNQICTRTFGFADTLEKIADLTERQTGQGDA
jgi:hypothetical protein